MAKRTKTTSGMSRAEAAQHDELNTQEPHELNLGEFIDELHGENVLSQPVDGMPSVMWLQDQFKTKSAIIRYLTSQKHEVKSIARHLGMRYQHVRNVAKSNLKRGPNEDWRKPYLEAQDLPNMNDFKSD